MERHTLEIPEHEKGSHNITNISRLMILLEIKQPKPTT